MSRPINLVVGHEKISALVGEHKPLPRHALLTFRFKDAGTFWSVRAGYDGNMYYFSDSVGARDWKKAWGILSDPDIDGEQVEFLALFSPVPLEEK